MKWIYILIVLVVTASALGCVGNKLAEAPVSTAGTPAPVQTTPAATPVPTSAEDLFGTESDITAMDSLVNDSSMDISLSGTI
ncbi:MAG: hypothetical protein PHU34_06005 [Candidatus Methanoperedens sp.]|nr:hypothetical protein [Candidatus Methanoperedens sp.]